MCAHRLFGEPDGLCCLRVDTHQPGHGCTYHASEAPDRHTQEASQA